MHLASRGSTRPASRAGNHGQDVWFRNLRLRTIPASEKLTPDPTFKQLPVPPEALAKEQARVRGMLEKAKKDAAPAKGSK